MAVQSSRSLREDESGRSQVRVIDKAFELLAALSKSPEGLSVAAIAERADVNRSTAHRILRTLEDERLVVRRDRHKFCLGLALFELGSKVTDRDIASHGPSLTYLRAAVDSLNLTGFLSVRESGRALYIEQVVGTDSEYITHPAGTSLPFHAGAASRVLLAFMAEQDIDRVLAHSFERLTAMTTTDPDVLRKDLVAIRQNGRAFARDDVVLGISAVGAPIINDRNEVIAAVSLTGLTSRIFGPDQEEITDSVRRVGARISNDLGWDGTPPKRLPPGLVDWQSE